MTNYKRFVSYFYQYDSGRKINNTGYARIETSDELCKVSLNCNLRTIPGRVCRVYFVKRNRDQSEGILTGTAITKADGVEARVTMPKGVMEDTNVRFYDITGIVVCFSKDNYFVTEWDNIPITYHQVASFEAKNSGNLVEVKDKKEEKKQPSIVEIVDTKSERVIEVGEVIPEKTTLEKEFIIHSGSEPKNHLNKIETIVEDKLAKEEDRLVENNDTVINAEDRIAVNNHTYVNVEDIVIIEDTDDRKEQNMIEEIIEESYKITEELEDRVLKAATITESSRLKEEGFNLTDEEKERKEEAKETKSEENFKVSSIEAANLIESKEDSFIEDELVLDDNDELVNVANCNTTPKVSEKEGWCDHPSARSIMDRFPHMYPFDDGEITECVRIEPKDLGLLPIDAWVLGNNSFLLHSFCSYRHLLFAKKITRDGIYYMVMVPGAYNAREKHMASMFGFKDFKCSRRRKLRDGDFGYWYTYIDYSNASTC